MPPGRWLRDTRVLAIDDRTAVVTTLFGYPDGAVEGVTMLAVEVGAVSGMLFVSLS